MTRRGRSRPQFLSTAAATADTTTWFGAHLTFFPPAQPAARRRWEYGEASRANPLVPLRLMCAGCGEPLEMFIIKGQHADQLNLARALAAQIGTAHQCPGERFIYLHEPRPTNTLREVFAGDRIGIKFDERWRRKRRDPWFLFDIKDQLIVDPRQPSYQLRKQQVRQAQTRRQIRRATRPR